MLRLLQFTDLHLRDDTAASVRSVVTQDSFDKAIYHARRYHWPADGILLTGDLAHDEFGNSYARLAGQAASWDTPVAAVPGNHDDRTALTQAFASVPKATRVLDFDRWRIVALDSQVPGAVFGRIDESERKLLHDAAANRADKHLLVALHHPPLAVGSAWLDPLCLVDGEAFRDELRELDVRVCVFGHAHQLWDSVDNGVRYLGTPSTGRQMKPRSVEFAETEEPPAYRWLRLHDNGNIDTGVVWVNT